MKFSCGLDVCLWCLIYVVNGLIMENFEDLFSLEDDDVSQMFITQEGTYFGIQKIINMDLAL